MKLKHVGMIVVSVLAMSSAAKREPTFITNALSLETR